VEASKYAETMCNELVTIASVQENPGKLNNEFKIIRSITISWRVG
jgi:hypothetical protein